MNTSIPPSFQPFVKKSIAKGWFASEDELMASALSALEEAADYHEKIQDSVEFSLAQANRGEFAPMNTKDIKDQLAREFDTLGNPK